jgi:hypothetical protein
MTRKKKPESAEQAAADELLLRALKQLADEALEEAIPERLLRPLRDARNQQNGAARPGQEPAPEPLAGRQTRSSRG